MYLLILLKAVEHIREPEYRDNDNGGQMVAHNCKITLVRLLKDELE
jgi:hypothetical protein